MRQTRAQLRGALQMIEHGRPIQREAVPLRRFDRHVVGPILVLGQQVALFG
jgi:hypothetical protein